MNLIELNKVISFNNVLVRALEIINIWNLHLKYKVVTLSYIDIPDCFDNIRYQIDDTKVNQTFIVTIFDKIEDYTTRLELIRPDILSVRIRAT